MGFINICITITIICYLIIVINMLITLKKARLNDYRAMIEDLDDKKIMEE